MRITQLGSLEVSVVGVGCNNFGRALDIEGTQAVVQTALDEGMNFFDASDNYGGGRCEGLLAEALGSVSSDVVIATKFGMEIQGIEGSGGARPEYVDDAVRRSLTELRRDWIDLYQLHKPDASTPIAETLGAMWQLVDQGLVREIGCSNLDAEQLTAALDAAAAAGREGFISNQMEFSLLRRPEAELHDVCSTRGVALLPFYPLASGMLTGKIVKGRTPEGRLRMDRYQHYLADEHFDTVERLRLFAAERDLTLPQVALGWLLAQSTVPAVTPGATKPEQIRSNAAATEWTPTPEDLDELAVITAPTRGGG